MAAINMHITAADISIVIRPVENGQSRVTVFSETDPAPQPSYIEGGARCRAAPADATALARGSPIART
jgi:hypothetical protein